VGCVPPLGGLPPPRPPHSRPRPAQARPQVRAAASLSSYVAVTEPIVDPLFYSMQSSLNRADKYCLSSPPPSAPSGSRWTCPC
jgi:hypothetical protein